MGALDIILIVIICAVLFGASRFMIKAKRSGQKCIGCPRCHSCDGNCSADLGRGRK